MSLEEYRFESLTEESPRRTLRTEARRKFICGLCVGIALGTMLFLGLYFGLPPRKASQAGVPDTGAQTTTRAPRSGVYDHAAVATDAGPCSVIGSDVLKGGGTVMDAAIASVICVGLHNSHSCGIGGGSFIIYYNSTSGESVFINSRETAPIKSRTDMYGGNGRLSSRGGLAIAVPGEIAGLWKAHQLYGKLPWADLLAPSIDMCENGYDVSNALASAIAAVEDTIRNRTFNLWPIFLNDDGSLKKEGDRIYRPLLASTLKTIAADGAESFYNGRLASDIVKDIEDGYGDSIITEDDLSGYKPEVKEPLSILVDDLEVLSPGPPSSGAVLSLILNVLDGYDFNESSLSDKNKALTYHRVVEAFRFAYAKRSALGDDRMNATITELARNMTEDWYADNVRLKISDDRTWPVEYYEPSFTLPDDHGTAHMSIVGPNGDAVSITSTINTYFGSKVRGRRTGIVFNNEMDDFSSPNVTNFFGVPPSPSNFIKPGNRPLSSMCPAIVIGNSGGRRKVKMVAGASGGTKITTATALVIMNALWFGKDIDTSVEMRRLHDQLMPNQTSWETGFDKEVVEGLISRGHITTENTSKTSSVAQAILVADDGKISAASDSRKGGYPSGF